MCTLSCHDPLTGVLLKSFVFYVEVRRNLSLRGRREGERRGGREDVDDRSQCQIGRLIKRKEGWCMGTGVSKSGERERERVA